MKICHFNNLIASTFQTAFVVLFPVFLLGQNILTGISSTWDDSFTEWIIFTENEATEGTFNMKWPLQRDWSEWTVELGSLDATIRTKWRNDFSRWELRSDEMIVDFSPIWRDDFTEWRFLFAGHQLKWQSAYKNDWNIWFMEDRTYGYLEMYTVFEGDPRDWEVFDDSLALPDEVKLAMLFTTLFYTMPRQ